MDDCFKCPALVVVKQTGNIFEEEILRLFNGSNSSNLKKTAFLLYRQILFSHLRLRKTDRESLRKQGQHRVAVRVQFFLRHQSKVHLLYRTLLHMPALHTCRFRSIRRTQNHLWLQGLNGNRRACKHIKEFDGHKSSFQTKIY